MSPDKWVTATTTTDNQQQQQRTMSHPFAPHWVTYALWITSTKTNTNTNTTWLIFVFVFVFASWLPFLMSATCFCSHSQFLSSTHCPSFIQSVSQSVSPSFIVVAVVGFFGFLIFAVVDGPVVKHPQPSLSPNPRQKSSQASRASQASEAFDHQHQLKFN